MGQYGTGNYEKCADCMAHCGYEPTAAADALAHPIKALMSSIRGVKTKGDMAPEIDLSAQRPAEYMFEKMVEELAIEPSNSANLWNPSRATRRKASKAWVLSLPRRKINEFPGPPSELANDSC